MDKDLNKWLAERDINNVADLKNYLDITFLGSVTNHNVKPRLDSSPLSTMDYYFRYSLDNADIISYQKLQYDTWAEKQRKLDAEDEAYLDE